MASSFVGGIEMDDDEQEQDPGFFCDWCHNTERFGPEHIELLIQNYAADPEKFTFCCYSCLARWVKA